MSVIASRSCLRTLTINLQSADVALTCAVRPLLNLSFMLATRLHALSFKSARLAVVSLCVVSGAVHPMMAQNTPLLSGGVGFFSNTNGGTTSGMPQIHPLIAVPVGDKILIESRSVLFESITPKGNGQSGFDSSHFVNLVYLQGDVHVAPHLTVVAGDFLLPFNTYNERLSEIWIGNLQDGPLIANVGTMSSGSGIGGMLAGSAASNAHFNLSYNGWFSARSGNEQFNAKRSTGARTSLYLPDSRVEMGFSYDRLLQGKRENFYGAHLWWEPKDTAFRLRSEYGSGQHAHGYWVEADYRTQAFGGPDSWTGRFEPVFRMQQTFRRDNVASDGLPPVNTQRADFGLDYNFPHNVRILTSYSRLFSSKNTNIWETGIVYRFLFPVWKGK